MKLGKKITIRIDVGHFVGHVYGDFPYYDENQSKIVEGSFGYYPEKGGFPKMLFGPGVVKDEAQETGRLTEPLPRQEVSLPLTEEAWIKLAHWITRKRKDKSYYILVGQNCSHFVDRALKEAGYTDGLLDKFDPANMQDLDFSLIKLDVVHYLRYDKREIYQPQSQVPIMDSRSEELSSGIVKHLSERAKEERNQSNKQSHYNHVNAFFDKYHDVNFYKTHFKDKSLTREDINWLIQNKIPGLEKENSVLFSSKPAAVEKQRQLEVFKQHAARKQQWMQPSRMVAAPKSSTGGVRQGKMPMVYNCPPPYAELPLFKAMSLKEPKSMARGGLSINFVD